MGVLSGGLSLPNRPMISAPDTSWTGWAGPCRCPAGLQQEARHSPVARQDQKKNREDWGDMEMVLVIIYLKWC